jgi:hypothetical protein
MKILILSTLAFVLASCSTAQQQRLDAFIKSDTGRALTRVAFQAGSAAIDHLATKGSIDGKEVAKAALGGASAELRKAQTPDTPLTASAAKSVAAEAVKDGSGVTSVARTVAPAVASAVADAVKKSGAPADLALEAAARGLDQAAARP